MNRFRSSLPKFKVVAPEDEYTPYTSSEDDDNLTLRKRLRNLEVRRKKMRPGVQKSEGSGCQRKCRGALVSQDVELKQRLDEIRWRSKEDKPKNRLFCDIVDWSKDNISGMKGSLKREDGEVMDTSFCRDRKQKEVSDSSLERLLSMHCKKFPKTFDQAVKEMNAHNCKDTALESKCTDILKQKTCSEGNRKNRVKIDTKVIQIAISSSQTEVKVGSDNLDTEKKAPINDILKEHAQKKEPRAYNETDTMKTIELVHSAVTKNPDLSKKAGKKLRPECEKQKDKEIKPDIPTQIDLEKIKRADKLINPTPTFELDRRLRYPPFVEPQKPEKLPFQYHFSISHTTGMCNKSECTSIEAEPSKSKKDGPIKEKIGKEIEGKQRSEEFRKNIQKNEEVKVRTDVTISGSQKNPTVRVALNNDEKVEISAKRDNASINTQNDQEVKIDEKGTGKTEEQKNYIQVSPKTEIVNFALMPRNVMKSDPAKMETVNITVPQTNFPLIPKRLAADATLVMLSTGMSPLSCVLAQKDQQRSLLQSVITKKSRLEEAKRDLLLLKEGIKVKASRSAELRDLVSQAMRDHKIFCIFDNHWYIVRPVREELLNRGWLEVIPDRRMIPRRRAPPTGPPAYAVAKEKSAIDHAAEAMLKAKETVDDDTYEKTPKLPAKKIMEKERTVSPPLKKTSDDSLDVVVSDFRIVAPNNGKKKTNVDIREFVSKSLTSEQGENKSDNEKISNPKQCKHNKTDQSTSTTEDSKVLTKTKVTAAEMGKLQNILHSEETGSDMLSITFHGQDSNNEPSREISRASLSENESKTVSKMIQATNARISLMWLSIKPGIHLKCFSYSPDILNKFQKTTFCTKIGLWSHLSNIQWYAHEVQFPAKSPRMYNTGEADDLQAFFQDFQMTACISILKWLTDTFFDNGIKAVKSKRGKVPLKAFEFAIRQCERYVKFRDNEDLGVVEEPKNLQDEWNTFLQWFYVITNDHGKIQDCSNGQLVVVYTRAIEILRLMKKHWPEIDIDGSLNMWIMKPYCASCGRGIFMTNNVYYISQHSRYIVQKYIERPLLIFNTKFDIRQWFMITRLTPLEIWMYKECYLRFCTQPFALHNLHESVHLSNNSVQRKYVTVREASLPDQNMWDSTTFQEYLRTVGHQNAWDEVIYPGMRDAIVSTMLAAQDTFDSPRKNWFEVYGADFMISAEVKDGPWLIEINENPAMDPSTKVTARLCPQMLRDVIKVVVDKRNNKNALTGQWELIYRQNYSPSYGAIDLDVKGKRIARVSQPIKAAGLSTSQHRVSSNEECDDKKQYEIVSPFKKSKPKVWKCREPNKVNQTEQNLNRDEFEFPEKSKKSAIKSKQGTSTSNRKDSSNHKRQRKSPSPDSDPNTRQKSGALDNSNMVNLMDHSKSWNRNRSGSHRSDIVQFSRFPKQRQ